MRISKLCPSNRVEGRWLVYLEDNEILRVGMGQIAEFGLCTGLELSSEQLRALRVSVKREELRGKALRALELRPLSRKELVRKLTLPPKRGCGREDGPPEPRVDPAEAEAVADWLEELGYLNDAEYARQVVRHYSAKGYGDRKLRDELYRRGVDRDLWDQAMEEAAVPEDKLDALVQKKMQGADPGDRRALKRTADALARRGYRWEEIREALSRYGAEPDD